MTDKGKDITNELRDICAKRLPDGEWCIRINDHAPPCIGISRRLGPEMPADQRYSKRPK